MNAGRWHYQQAEKILAAVDAAVADAIAAGNDIPLDRIEMFNANAVRDIARARAHAALAAIAANAPVWWTEP